MARILVIDDDAALQKALSIALSARGYEVEGTRAGEDGVVRAASRQPDVVVLDLGLPDISGIEVCRRIRAFSLVPIVVLSAAGDERAKVEALDTGADDYVTKPFGMAELEARLRVALRHRAPQAEQGATAIEVGPLRVDLVHHEASCEGRPLELTSKEFDLLAFLARHAGKVCTHHMILSQVWGPGYQDEAHYLRVYAHRIRRKLGAQGSLLRTHPGIGYQLALE
jgi:two-component system KDP operon response regulator KdpE